MKVRINLSDAVADLMPPNPPCFKNHIDWGEYLKSAAAVQNHKGEPRVIEIVSGEPQFCKTFNFCVDCTQVKSVEMMTRNRCKPEFLKDHYDKDGTN